MEPEEVPTDVEVEEPEVDESLEEVEYLSERRPWVDESVQPLEETHPLCH